MAELKRVLGFWTMLSLSIGSIIGTGLFFGPAIASRYSGNASILAWLILSIIAVYISFYFAELVSMYPKAGGIYEFSKHSYGRFFSFLMGWTAWIVGNLTTALLIVAATDYLITDSSQVTLKVLISIAFIILLNLVAYFGIEASAILLVIFAIVPIMVILSIIIPGFFHLNYGNYSPFFSFGISSLLLTVFFMAESFFGWEGATYLAEETQNPEKVIPKAIVVGTIIVAVLGVFVTLISLGVIPWKILADSIAPLSIVSGSLLGTIGTGLLNIGIFISLVGAAAGGIVTMPRLILALARDKLFIAQFSSIHEKFRTPYKAIIFQTIVSLLIFGMTFGKYNGLLSLVLPLGFIMYFFIILSVVLLRKKEPLIPRTIKVPFVKTGSFFLMVFIIAILAIWIFPGFTSVNYDALDVLKFGFSLIFVGVPIYLLLEIYYDPDAIIKINDSLAYVTLWMERFILPKGIRRELLALLGDVKGKKVLEFGCSVGTLTMYLAQAVNPNGRVYATDLSDRDLVITKKRLQKKGHTHVIVIHDEHQINRVHPSIPHVNAIVSVGMMGYLQDVKKVLKEMRELLPYGGKIVFLDYVDFFKVIPNVAWLSSDRTIEKIFREAGFSVFVMRKKGLFWNYVYVYGIKFHEDIPYI
ncbi:MAG TPA: amino acid permease [Candidatus Nanoarchaeia archaeon]|nr:amino acid permease [Candidatus Nanoarchaeia archaeon]